VCRISHVLQHLRAFFHFQDAFETYLNDESNTRAERKETPTWFECVHVCMSVCVHVCMRACVYVCMFLPVCTVWMGSHVLVCMDRAYDKCNALTPLPQTAERGELSTGTTQGRMTMREEY
jgi:hypothetical protein